MTSHLDIILLLFVVFFVFGKLKSVLGSSPEMQEIKLAQKDAKKLAKKIITEQEGKEDVSLSEVDKSLSSIANFNKDAFITAAKRVFEIVLESYANNKPSAIKPLTNKALFEKFEEAIKQKEAKKEETFAELISFKNVEIIDVKILKTLAKVQVSFQTEQMNITKDEEGNIINGDEQFIQTIADIWTFEKPLNSSTPIWLLSSTKK